MARARNIKPAFFQNELLAELDPLSRLAFIGLWTIADYKGCIELRTKRLKVQILPYDECDFESIVNNLTRSGFISIYSVLSQRYIKIVNFTKHQTPHKNERESGSLIPDIDNTDCEINELTQDGTTPDKNGTTRADSLNLIPDSLLLIPDSGILKPEQPPRAKRTPPAEKPPDVDEQVWLDWIQLRKAKRAPVTKTVIDGAASEAAKAGLPLNEFLKVWCARGSQGLEASWLRNASNQSNGSTRHDRIDENFAILTGRKRKHDDGARVIDGEAERLG